MPQMLMVTVKYVLIVCHFEIDEIEVFVDIAPSTFDIDNVSHLIVGSRPQAPYTLLAHM